MECANWRHPSTPLFLDEKIKDTSRDDKEIQSVMDDNRGMVRFSELPA